MGFQEEFRAVMSRMTIAESDWKFVTSAGAELTVGTPIVHLGVNATGGALWVKRDSDANPTTLAYGGIGGSASLSAIPSPANFSYSFPDFPSAGRVYKLPLAGGTLSRNEFLGAFVLIEIAADFYAGHGGALMFIGGNTTAAGIAGAINSNLQIPALMATSKACVAFHGWSGTIVPGNVGISFYIGGITPMS